MARSERITFLVSKTERLGLEQEVSDSKNYITLSELVRARALDNNILSKEMVALNKKMLVVYKELEARRAQLEDITQEFDATLKQLLGKK